MTMDALQPSPASAMLAADRRFWDRTAEKYAADPIADFDGYRRTLRRIADLLPPAAQVLEVGCGTGTTALALAPQTHWLTATDISGEMIAIARRKAADAGIRNLTFERADVSESGHGGPAFDAVIACNILHLVPDLDEALAALARRLRPGGLLISKTPCLKEMNPLIRLAIPLMRMVGKAPASVLALDSGDIRAALKRAGFTIEAEECHASKGKDIRPFIVARKA